MATFKGRYRQVFTPGAPIEARSLLFGRDGDLSKLRRYLSSPGLHLVWSPIRRDTLREVV
jgi:hypothetical protein